MEAKLNLIPIHVMGKQYMVPDVLTVMKAMEYAGYQLTRGCGCRGASSTPTGPAFLVTLVALLVGRRRRPPSR